MCILCGEEWSIDDPCQSWQDVGAWNHQKISALESQDGHAKYKEAAEFQLVHSDSGQIVLR